jgi:hypothetical protein
MNYPIADTNTFTWADYEPVGFPTCHITALELYRDNVAHSSLKVLSDKIDELQKCDDAVALFALHDYEPMYQSTVEGYLLIVQSMWERGLRGMLNGRAKQLSKGDSYIGLLHQASWSGKKQPDLHHYFYELMGLPLRSFDSYDDLDLLQMFGNVLRHGDGHAARKLHRRCPSLWLNLGPGAYSAAREPFSAKFSSGSLKYPSVADITLPAIVFEQMVQSVVWFWEDIEYIRCNSFKRKHPSVVKKLDQHRLDRLNRSGKRVWNPG